MMQCLEKENKKWNKIIQILRETNIEQIRGDYIKFKVCDDNGELLPKPEFLGKCALGVLACATKNKELHMDRENIKVPPSKIMKEYGIDDDEIYPFLYHANWNGKLGWDYHRTMELSRIIIKLNDKCELSFEQIAEFLEITFGSDLKGDKK